MGFKLWVSFCTETMRKGEKLSSLPISTTVPELQGCSTKIFKCFLLEKGSSHLAKAQHPLHLLNISLYSSNISRNCIFFTCFSLVIISRSCLSTLKADFTALQWIQYFWHQAEGDLLRTGIFEL